MTPGTSPRIAAVEKALPFAIPGCERDNGPADELAKEIEEQTGGPAPGIG